ncbi:MFS transporter [Streptomyces sp. NPDC048606]|uniref:MFS transporter n=1 Tax=Streptomyces sp. NPDC048606 TaxID=3154726 RepID=UPI00343E54DD
MTRPPGPLTARRRYATACALYWLPLGLAVTPLVLLFTERGIPLPAIAGFFVAHSLTAAALELPTGGLSDVVGRRPVLAAAGLLNLAAFTLQGLGTAPWVLTLGMALMGAARALSSGPTEAWYVDTVQAHSGPDADLRTGLARGDAASSAALAAGTLLGGALPWLLARVPDLAAGPGREASGPVIPLAVPPLAAAVIEIAFVLYVLTALPEPPRPPRPPGTQRSLLRGIPATVAEGLRLGGRDVLVRRVLFGAAAAGSALATIELLTPGRAAALTGAPESGAMLFAALACAGFVCSAVGSQLAPRAARLAGGGERAVLLGLGVAAGGLLLLAVGAGTDLTGPVPSLLAAGGYGLVYLGLGTAGPNENDLLHRRVPAAGRATALSVQSLALQLTGALSGMAAGSMTPGPLPWLPALAALVAAAFLWGIRRSGTVPADPDGPAPQRSADQRRLRVTDGGTP